MAAWLRTSCDGDRLSTYRQMSKCRLCAPVFKFLIANRLSDSGCPVLHGTLLALTSKAGSPTWKVTLGRII